MAAIENIEWLNQNKLRAYPIREDADTVPLLTNGAQATGIKLPTCLVTDFSFTLAFDAVTADTVPALTGVSHAGDGFSLEISLGDTVLTSITASIATHTVNKTYRLFGAGEYADCGGWITLGDLKRAAEEIPEGVYKFPAGQVPFEISTLHMAPRGVRSITAVGKYGLKTYTPLYGNVRIIAGSDMTVRNDSAANAIWLQAESSTGYERNGPCKCGAAATNVVRSINGMPVENVIITGDDTSCVAVNISKSSTVHTITLEDTCSTPCCGCAELNFVESAITAINKSISVLNGYAASLGTRLEELMLNLETTKASFNAYPKDETAT